ncbi:adenylate/guanylate cyclase domain-containing protein [Paenibacillus filicis]|uniref:Adenylate/guanylate cyclase domain-containing protein n=1 Tax=Paenibacillus gyeongsangnamensis TaxID=3388067 RepID=A0ABT4Q5G1_9BACL|nr:adenylate/guanylate cyclase domain-containing protein [Paenibacillus filicis]MCZ8512102.1 adenylate/guanylate cyclase domain-containing protein [Paenibacillus filicis]
MKMGFNKTAVIALGNLAVVVLCVILLSNGLLNILSYQLYDFNVKETMSQQPHEDIVVIGIDENSIKEVGPYPWDRKVYARLIQQLEKAGAKVLAFDIELYTKSAGSEGDKLLAEELGKYKNIILPSHAKLENDFTRTTKAKAGQLLMAQSVVDPIPMFSKNNNKAHINAAYDTDGIIRSNWLQINTPQGVYPSMGLAVAQLAGVDVSRFMNLPSIEGSPRSEMPIRWDAGEYDFETIPFSKVLNGAVPPQTFKDRLVLVGYTAPGSDEGPTPVEKHMHLVYAHANILNQILKGQVITPANKQISIGLAVLILILFGWFTWRMRAISGIVLMLGIIALITYGQFVLFKTTLHYVDVMGAVACGLISYLVNIAMKTYFETKQKNYITKQFGRYISPDLVKEIASSEQEIQLGGISKELTILFLDVRGFTPLSERLKPEEVVDFLNMMFNLITERALANHGTIDKFIGDAAMILYNAPLDVPDHPYYAVKTAYEIQQGMEKVRADVLEKYGVTISVGIGINTGDVVVGNIGSYLRVDYTAIGDNVNTAARIESNTHPNQVLVSEATYELTKMYFEYNYAGEKLMKGKSVPLKLFEVTGLKCAPESAANRLRPNAS